MNRIKLASKFFILQAFILFVYSSVVAQEVAKPETENTKIVADKVWNIDFISSIDFPQADLAKRFGTSYRIGVGIKHKSQNNWLFGGKFEFITGSKMRDDSLLINLKTAQGAIITQSGQLYNVGTFQRGYMASFQVGKIFPFWQLNKNSGPMMLASFGFMQYKINLFDKDNSFPQLRGDYKKGYDRLTNGLFIEDFIGYQYLAKNKLIKPEQIINKLAQNTLEIGKEYYQNQTQLLHAINEGTSLTGKLSKGVREELTNTNAELQKYGISFQDIVTSSLNYTAETSKFNLINTETFEKVAQSAKAYVGELGNLTNMLPDFEKIGYGASDTAKQIQTSGQRIMKLGLDSKSMLKEV